MKDNGAIPGLQARETYGDCRLLRKRNSSLFSSEKDSNRAMNRPIVSCLIKILEKNIDYLKENRILGIKAKSEEKSSRSSYLKKV